MRHKHNQTSLQIHYVMFNHDTQSCQINYNKPNGWTSHSRLNMAMCKGNGQIYFSVFILILLHVCSEKSGIDNSKTVRTDLHARARVRTHAHKEKETAKVTATSITLASH